MKITLSNTKYIQERRRGTILGWLSDVGGLNDAFLIILAPLIALISSKSFILSVMNGMPASSESAEDPISSNQ